MSQPGLTTPIQPVGRRGGRWPVPVGFGFVLVVGLLIWHPWSDAAQPSAADARVASPPAAIPSRARSDPPFEPPIDPGLFAVPTIGPWSGRLTAEWSVVAFIRADPATRDPMNLRQQQVAVFAGPVPLPGDLSTICDQTGTFLHPGTADLVSGEVMFLGFAFPPGTEIDTATLDRLDGPLRVVPIDLGRIPGGPSATAVTGGSALPSAPGTSASLAPFADPSTPRSLDPVRMFAQPDGGTWPDGVYRFSVALRPTGPQELFACIRP